MLRKSVCQCSSLCAFPRQRQNPWEVNHKSSSLHHTDDPIKKNKCVGVFARLIFTDKQKCPLSLWVFLVVPYAQQLLDCASFGPKHDELPALKQRQKSQHLQYSHPVSGSQQIEKLVSSVIFRRFLTGIKFKGVLCIALGQGKMRMGWHVRQQ